MALQLLCIMDFVKIWAEYSFKLAIGTCISRLRAKRDRSDTKLVKEDVWRFHVLLNEKYMTWLF